MIYNLPRVKKKEETTETGETYLTFSSPSTFSIKVSDPGWNGTIEYSTDAKTWNTWDGSEVSSVASDNECYVYFRGTGNTKIMGPSSMARWTLTGSNIACLGNIETLLDYATVEAGEHPTMASGCYREMFFNCTALTTAPELPATTLADYCYYCMFQSCTALTTAPELPATTLASGCYHSMFQDCTALTTAPELPATTLADYCYYYMFSGCKALTTAPALPATTLAMYCYEYMFSGCKALTTAPELPATTLKNYCYHCMFQGCTKIKLSETQTDKYTQAYRIPTSGEGTTTSNAMGSMFTNTGGTFSDTPEINTTYYLHKDCAVV